MRISRVYIDAELVGGQVIALDKAQSHYLKKVLRLKHGAAFFLFNGRAAVDFEARLLVDGKRLAAEIGAAQVLTTEAGLSSEVIQGLGRLDRVDWVIQKTTELGASRLSIFNAEHSQSPLKPAQLEKKLLHWQGVAISACEQCGRAIIPEIRFYDRLEQALEASPDGLKLLLDFDGEPLAASLRPAPSTISILLGPEGGLNPREVDLATGFGFQPVSLGTRVLRFETAATVALAVAQSSSGNSAL